MPTEFAFALTQSQAEAEVGNEEKSNFFISLHIYYVVTQFFSFVLYMCNMKKKTTPEVGSIR